MQEILTQSRSESWARACELAVQAREEAGRCVLLVGTYDDQVRMKHYLAERGCGFGIDVETLKSWVADLWEMYGDGRVMASSTDRALYVRLAMKRYREKAGKDALLELTAGMEKLAQRLIRMAPGEVIAADKDPGAYRLTLVQRDVVAVAANARRLMAQAGFAEPARACDYLAKEGVVGGMRVVALDVETMCAHDRLLASADSCVVLTESERGQVEGRSGELNALAKTLYHPDFDHPVCPTGAVRFAFPAGEYASNQLICDEVARTVGKTSAQNGVSSPVRVAITAPDALKAFRALAPRLVKAGMSVSASGLVAFPKTPFGRAWAALLEFSLNRDRLDVLRAGDFALSEFSAMGVRQAYGIDARLRGWRGQTFDDALTDMTSWAKDEWREFLSLFSEDKYTEALEAQKSWIGAQVNWPEAYRLAQLRVVEVALDVHKRAEALGLEPRDALEILHEMMLPYETQVAPENQAAIAEVHVGTLTQMALEPAATYDVVVLSELDAEHYSLRDEETSVDALLRVLGVWKPARRVEKLRLRFASSLGLARCTLLLHRVLNTVDASELRPSALLEELVDCYRQDPCNPEEVDEETGLPQCLQSWCATLGEGELDRVIDAEGAPSPLDAQVPLLSTGYLEPGDELRVLMPSRDEGGSLLPWPILSPSAIEKYLECPYKWFADRRLKLSGVDAEMGPIAFGNFAHAALERLHEQLRVTGLRRVTENNLDMCDVLLDGIFDKLLVEQFTSYDSNALIPLTPLEELEVDTFRRELHDYLRREADLLPDFEPYKQELKFGWDEPFEYAGVRIRGSIDRVDVDMGGRAVVLDYKNSAGQNYCFWPKVDKNSDEPQPLVLPRKMQTLIYAQVVRRKLGLIPVGALYIAYGKKPGIAGLYDKRALNSLTDLPGIDADRCATTDMLEALDCCEEMVAARLRDLAAGKIEPAPCDADACEYCPVVQCSVRDGIAEKGAM